MHSDCLENTIGDDDQFFCERCKHETFLCNLTVKTQVKNSEGVQYVRKIFGKPQAEAAVTYELPPMPNPPADFGIGVIHGSSGSGKSQILKKRFDHSRGDSALEWEHDEVPTCARVDEGILAWCCVRMPVDEAPDTVRGRE